MRDENTTEFMTRGTFSMLQRMSIVLGVVALLASLLNSFILLPYRMNQCEEASKSNSVRITAAELKAFETREIFVAIKSSLDGMRVTLEQVQVQLRELERRRIP